VNQLSLLELEPKRFDENRKPDNRHPWLILRAWGGRPADWRCEVCGELATVNLYGDAWVFLRPQLAEPHSPRGHYDEQQSHDCEPRAWQ